MTGEVGEEGVVEIYWLKVPESPGTKLSLGKQPTGVVSVSPICLLYVY